MNVFDTDIFPNRPALSGYWTPLYFEPIIGSGERITVAIAAIGNNSEIKIVPTVTLNILSGILPRRTAEQAANLIIIATRSYEKFVHDSNNLNGWKPPVQGFFKGETYEAEGEVLNDIIDEGLRFSSVFSPPKVSGLKEENLLTSSQLSSKVKDYVLRQHPSLERFFGVRMNIFPSTSKIGSKFNFVGGNYALNFDICTTLKGRVGLAAKGRMKVTHLGMLRDAVLTSESRHKISHFEYVFAYNNKKLISSEKKTTSSYEDVVGAIRDYAKKSDIEMVTLTNVEEIGERILKKSSSLIP
jgi:hypothetical protein